MDMKPLALMLVLTALAVSEPARLFEAVMNIVVNVLKLVIHLIYHARSSRMGQRTPTRRAL